jgi:hypothetical protein
MIKEYNPPSGETNVSECLPKKRDRKAYHKAYREANKKKRKAYREANKERIKDQTKAYYEANKEQIREREKAYREANKEQIKAYKEANKEKSKAYREANKARIKKYNKEYAKQRLKEDSLFSTKIKLRNCVYYSFKRIRKNKKFTGSKI